MGLNGRLEVTATPAEVEFAFTVTNTDTEALELTFPSGQIFEITVFEDDGAIWRRSDGMMFTQAVQTETIEPGESVGYHAVWDDPAPGRYVAEASLEAADSPVVASAEFEVQLA